MSPLQEAPFPSMPVIVPPGIKAGVDAAFSTKVVQLFSPGAGGVPHACPHPMLGSKNKKQALNTGIIQLSNQAGFFIEPVKGGEKKTVKSGKLRFFGWNKRETGLLSALWSRRVNDVKLNNIKKVLK